MQEQHRRSHSRWLALAHASASAVDVCRLFGGAAELGDSFRLERLVIVLFMNGP
jgi:hypothetical protein